MAQNKILPSTHVSGKDARNGVRTPHRKSVSMKSRLFLKGGRPACSNAAVTVSSPKATKLSMNVINNNNLKAGGHEH